MLSWMAAAIHLLGAKLHTASLAAECLLRCSMQS